MHDDYQYRQRQVERDTANEFRAGEAGSAATARCFSASGGCWRTRPIALMVKPLNTDNETGADTRKRFELWRLDDNGNEFLIETFASRQAAEFRQRQLEAGGHKQTYWVKAIEA